MIRRRRRRGDEVEPGAFARPADRIAVAAYLGASGRFDRAPTGFAQSCADQNERDFEALGAACRSGRPARSGRIRAERL
ncbi:DUF2252 family protein [Streptomyces sp. NPDC058293]|uniref:DUF2252 family protein n=1 Tax=Streptomyces sp. NPDC058293 TaxID=3346429 RepID=UPI0036E12EB9